MDEAAVLLRHAGHVIAGGPLGGLGGPVGAHIGKDLGAVGEQLHEQHPQTVEHVVLRGQDVGLPGAAVVEAGVQQGLRVIAVGIEVGPLALALEAAGDGVVAHHLLLAALRQVGVAVHQVLDDAVHLDGELPGFGLLFRGGLHEVGVLVPALLAVLLGPGQGLLELGLVVNSLGHAADDLDLVHALHPHPKVILDEVLIDDGPADAHAHGTDLQVALAPHGGHGHGGPAEAEQLLPYVGGDVGDLVQILHLMAVDAEGGQALLGVGGQHGGQIHRAGALGAVEAPHALDGHGVHVHSLRAVAPAGGDGEGDVHVLLLELGGAGGCLGHPSDGGVGNDHLHRLAVAVENVLLKQLLGGLGHGHGLVLQGFTDLQRAAAAVDDGTDADDGILADVPVLCHDDTPPDFSSALGR